ncbi:MAG: hypothetical protein WCL18_02050 [bacterium]
MKKKDTHKKQNPSVVSESDASESHNLHKKYSKFKKDLKKVLIDLFMISDLKNRAIRPELRSIKHDIVDNLD